MPTRDDYITQIEADLAAGTEDEAILKERLAVVKRAKTDASARDAYHEHAAKNHENDDNGGDAS